MRDGKGGVHGCVCIYVCNCDKDEGRGEDVTHK